MRAKLTIGLICLAFTYTYAQEKQPADSLSFNKLISSYSIDVSGNIYVALEGGTITKYSPELDSLLSYSPIQVGNVKLLEAGSGLRIFAFYDFYQEYLLTNRFLTQPVLSKLTSSSLDFVEIATQSQNNNIWLVENSGLRLVKYNPTTQTIDIETFLSPIVDSDNPSFTFLKEYQNQVFLVDQNSGIYVFDNLGNFSRKISTRTTRCTFYGNKIAYLQENQLVISDLYGSDEVHKKLTTDNVEGILIYKNKNYLIKPKQIIRY